MDRPMPPSRERGADRGEDVQKRISSLKGHIQDLAHIRGTVIPPNGYCEPRGIREEDKQIVSELYAAARMLAIPAEEIKLTGDYRSVQGLVADIRMHIKYCLFDLEASGREAGLKAAGKLIPKPNN
ncbi:MAG: hypothetical protein AABX12_02855 [Nanoarchaeota archaeon]